MFAGYRVLTNETIKTYYMRNDREFAAIVQETVTAGLPKLLDYFGVASGFPPVTAVLVPNRDEFDRLVRDLLKVAIEVPSFPARIAQPQRTDMVVLSPSAYEMHSTFEYVPENFRRLLVHELVHMMEEFLSPDIEASPTWWSEGLAVYLSEQSRYEDGFRSIALDAIASGTIPELQRILADGRLAYDWGWPLVQFIEATAGRETILRVTCECADGAVLSFLGEESGAFEDRWRCWLRDGGHLVPPHRS